MRQEFQTAPCCACGGYLSSSGGVQRANSASTKKSLPGGRVKNSRRRARSVEPAVGEDIIDQPRTLRAQGANQRSTLSKSTPVQYETQQGIGTATPQPCGDPQRPGTGCRRGTPLPHTRPATSRRPGTPQRPATPAQRPRTAANVTVASVCDWSDPSRLVDCSANDMRGRSDSVVEDDSSRRSSEAPYFDARSVTGRMFVREKTTLTKGEQAIIGGIVRNKSDIRVPFLRSTASKSVDASPSSNFILPKNDPDVNNRDAWLLRHNNYFLEALEGAHNLNPVLISDGCQGNDTGNEKQKSKEWREQGILQTSRNLCKGLSISPRMTSVGSQRNGMISDRAGNIVYDPTRDGQTEIRSSDDFAQKTGFFVTAQKFRFFKFPELHLGALDRDRNREKHDLLRKRKIPPIVIPNRQGRVTVKHVVEERTKEEGKKTKVKKAYVDVFLPTAGSVYYPEEELLNLSRKAQAARDNANNTTNEDNTQIVVRVNAADDISDCHGNDESMSEEQSDLSNGYNMYERSDSGERSAVSSPTSDQ